MKNFKALNDVVVIKNDETEDVTDSGLYIPTDAQDEPARGTIVSFGSQVLDADMLEGRRVFYKKFAGHKMVVEGEELLLVPYEDILLVEKG
jgi:co-chaperonin GroES (HSP10)